MNSSTHQKNSEPQQSESSINRNPPPPPPTFQTLNTNDTAQNSSLNPQVPYNLEETKYEKPPPSYDELQFTEQVNYHHQDVAAPNTISSPTHPSGMSSNYYPPPEVDMTHQTALCLVNWIVAFSLCLIFILIYGAFNMFKFIRTENFHLQNQHDSFKNNGQ